VPRETTPSITGGYGEEREDLPDTSILEIKPHTKHEPYPQPSTDLSGKDKGGIWKDARDYAGTEQGKADLERRETAKRRKQPIAPYGELWKKLTPQKGSGTRAQGDFEFEWDYAHGGEIEVYQRGQHLGALDPLTTEWKKPYDEDRPRKKENRK